MYHSNSQPTSTDKQSRGPPVFYRRRPVIMEDVGLVNDWRHRVVLACSISLLVGSGSLRLACSRSPRMLYFVPVVFEDGNRNDL